MRLLVAALVSQAVGGCASDDDVVEIGRLYQDELASIQAPATAAVGQPFTVRVTTEGNAGQCISLDTTDRDQTDTGGTMTPYDRRHIPGEHEGCILILTPLMHEAEFTFDTPGMKRIDVNVRRPSSQGYEPTIVPIDVVVE